MNRILHLLLLLFFLTPASGQDVEGFFGTINERIDQKDILRANGRMGINANWNTITGLERRQQAFSWSANAGINLDFLGINAPFSAAFSNGNDVYNLPSYSFYGISPTYKWITLHGGDRSVNLSPYTFSGINFRGVGIELKPKKWEFAAFRGRLRRASVANIGSVQNIESPYQRQGSGSSLGYNGTNTKVKVAAFHGKDILNATPNPATTDTLDKPAANLALSLSLDQQLSSKLNFTAVLARTALTRNTDTPSLLSPSFSQRMFGLFSPQVSTGYHNAYEFSINFAPGSANYALNYKYVDPGYQTLGSLFFQNDLENITFSTMQPLLEGKLNANLNAGIQRNNLAGQSSDQFSRIIAAVNLNATPNEQVMIQLSYSNFNTTNRLRAINQPFVLTDSIVIVQTNQNYSVNASYLIDPTSKSSTINLTLSHQRANAIRNEQLDSTALQLFTLGVLNYSYRRPKSDFSISTGLLFHRNSLSGNILSTLGPNLTVTNGVFQGKVKLTNNISYSMVNTASTSGSSVLRWLLSTGIPFGKKQTINLSASYVDNFRAVNRFTEFNIQAGFAYNLSLLGKKKPT